MSSDFVSILVAARWGSVGLMVIVLVMMTYILCLRAVLLMRERRYAKLSARWTPILLDRKSTRLNSSHLGTSYAASCLKKQTAETAAELPGPAEHTARGPG